MSKNGLWEGESLDKPEAKISELFENPCVDAPLFLRDSLEHKLPIFDITPYQGVYLKAFILGAKNKDEFYVLLKDLYQNARPFLSGLNEWYTTYFKSISNRSLNLENVQTGGLYVAYSICANTMHEKTWVRVVVMKKNDNGISCAVLDYGGVYFFGKTYVLPIHAKFVNTPQLAAFGVLKTSLRFERELKIFKPRRFRNMLKRAEETNQTMEVMVLHTMTPRTSQVFPTWKVFLRTSDPSYNFAFYSLKELDGDERDNPCLFPNEDVQVNKSICSDEFAEEK